MPYKSGAEFARKHNKKLKGGAADKAAKIATAMEKSGAPIGVAIATANKAGNKAQGFKKGGLVRGGGAAKAGLKYNNS